MLYKDRRTATRKGPRDASNAGDSGVDIEPECPADLHGVRGNFLNISQSNIELLASAGVYAFARFIDEDGAEDSTHESRR